MHFKIYNSAVTVESASLFQLFTIPFVLKLNLCAVDVLTSFSSCALYPTLASRVVGVEDQ